MHQGRIAPEVWQTIANYIFAMRNDFQALAELLRRTPLRLDCDEVQEVCLFKLVDFAEDTDLQECTVGGLGANSAASLTMVAPGPPMSEMRSRISSSDKSWPIPFIMYLAHGLPVTAFGERASRGFISARSSESASSEPRIP